MIRQIDDQSATYPRAGDYWSEMLCPICIVLEVNGESVTLCKTKIFHAEGWEWDLDAITVTTRQQFKKWLSYDTCLGYWARVSYSLEFHKRVLQAYQSRKGNVVATCDPMCEGQQLEMDFNPPFLSMSSISSPHTQ